MTLLQVISKIIRVTLVLPQKNAHSVNEQSLVLFNLLISRSHQDPCIIRMILGAPRFPIPPSVHYLSCPGIKSIFQDGLIQAFQILPWILDVDTTVKPLYGHQEDAVKGYNPQKPGRPSHTHHSYLIADLRLVLDVEVKAGDQSHSNYSLPGLIDLLNRLPENARPAFVRGDIGWGTDAVMTDLEATDQRYLVKLKKTKKTIELIYKHHGLGEWISVHPGWEAKEDALQLQDWKKPRRVVIIRRQLPSNNIIGIESEGTGQQQLSFIDGPENMKAFEYSVLVTDLENDLISVFHHYRDRADCENNFDELKNQWGWGGYTTKDVKSCRLMSRTIALIYNWWNLYVRLALPDQHHEAITSRPLLLSGIGQLKRHRSQQTIRITSMLAGMGRKA